MKFSARNLWLRYRAALQASYKLQADRIFLYSAVMSSLFSDAWRVTRFEIPIGVSIGVAALTAQVGAFAAILDKETCSAETWGDPQSCHISEEYGPQAHGHI